jgi:hypothetical protein
MATSALPSDPATIGSANHQRSLSNLQEQEKAQRGPRNFLTWSFFLAQIAASQDALGAFAATPAADDPAAMQKTAGPETGAGSAVPLPSPVPAQADMPPQGQAGRGAESADIAASKDAALESTPVTLAIGDTDAMSARMAAGGGPASGGMAAGEGNAIGEIAAGGDWAPHIGAAMPDLLGDMIDIADGVLPALSPDGLAGEVLESAGWIVSMAGDAVDIGLDSGLFVQAQAGDGQIMLAANLGGDAGAGPYSDTLLALTAGSSLDVSVSAPAPSFLQSIPVLGDVLSPPDTNAGGDHAAPPPADFMADVTHSLDPIGSKLMGDLWS